MSTRIVQTLAASAVMATLLVLAFPSSALAGLYYGPTVYCNGACPVPEQHCVPVNVGSYPIICSGNGTCPVSGPLGCNPGQPCAYYATWDCKCRIEGGGYADVCPAD